MTDETTNTEQTPANVKRPSNGASAYLVTWTGLVH